MKMAPTRIGLQLLALALLFGPAFAPDLRTPTAVIPNTYFGLHIHHLILSDQMVPTPWPEMPVPAWRLWDAGANWPDLEPAKGLWQFQRLDRYVAMAQQHGTQILLPLGGSPVWASARPQSASPYGPGFTAEPANIEDWRTYVRTVVTHYKGRIQAYEIWNEPNLRDFWTGSTDEMVTLTKEASQIIRSVDPHALIVSPSATSGYGLPWLADFLKKGGGSYVDVIGYHFYVNPHTESPEEMLPLIRGVEQTLADNNLGDLPVWNTECGWLMPAHFDSDETAAGYLARAYVLAWAAGVQRFYWYAWDNRSLAIVTYNETTSQVTPAGHAYQVVEQWLVGARMESCSEDADHTWVCSLNRAGKRQWIVWNSQGSRTFQVPQTWHAAYVTPLLHDRQPFSAAAIEAGAAPVLLTGNS